MRKVVAIFMLVSFALLVVPEAWHCHAGMPEQQETSACGHCCPDGDDQGHDHDGGTDSCVGCPCHAPADLGHFAFTPHRIASSLVSPEIRHALPEVYLTRFIPPQNA